MTSSKGTKLWVRKGNVLESVSSAFKETVFQFGVDFERLEIIYSVSALYSEQASLRKSKKW